MTDYRDMSNTLLKYAPITPAVLAWPAVKSVGKSVKNLFDRGAQAAYQGISPDPTVDSGPILSDVLNMALTATPGAEEGAAGVFGGRLAKTSDQGSLSMAKALAENGADKGFIWEKTGWFQGADKAWRNEINDSNAAFVPNAAEAIKNNWKPRGDGTYGEVPPTAGEIFSHPDLYAAYPDLKDIKLVHTDTGRGYSQGGVIGLNTNLGAEDLKSVMLHELMHQVQSREGFAKGGNTLLTPFDVSRALEKQGRPDLGGKALNVDPYQIYRHLAGEVEARNVQARRNFPPKARALVPPWETQDVPTESQIPLGQILSQSLSQ